MAFRSPENVQRNELIRYQLQDNIRVPANGQEQLKKLINSSLLIGAVVMIGTMPFLKCNLN